MRHRHGVAAALLLLVMSTLGPGAAAQPATGPTVDFVVTPSRLELRAAPGDTFDVAVKVYNRAPEELTLVAYVEDIAIPVSELLQPDELAYTASRWVRFVTPEVEVAGGDQGEATLQVAIPPATPSGGYHAFGFLQSVVEGGADSLQPSGRIGVTLLLEVAPEGVDVNRAARVSVNDLRVRWDGIFDPEVAATTVVDNIGDAHVVTGGLHTYRSWPGAKSLEAKIGPNTTLRGTRHAFESSWGAVPLLGKVTVTSELVYQAGPNELPAIVLQETVWIIPWHLLGALLVVLTAGFAVAWRRRRKRPTRQPEVT